jgi:hypothetical protein
VALELIMAVQRPSFPACPWSFCPTLPKEVVMCPPSGRLPVVTGREGEVIVMAEFGSLRWGDMEGGV